jgi:hypothetical protein
MKLIARTAAFVALSAAAIAFNELVSGLIGLGMGILQKRKAGATVDSEA